MRKIFIQLASYRDEELVPTVVDAIQKAQHPERLVFGVVDQTCYSGIAEDTEGLSNIDLRGAELRLRFYNYTQAQGMCWAREEAQKFYQGEDFVFQIDSHMRFIKNWDTELVDMWDSLPGHKKLLSTYPPGYTPPNQRDLEGVPHAVGAHKFERDGLCKNWACRIMEQDTPQLGFTTAGGFIFGNGSWVHDVPSDPQQYFGLEEICLAVRSWTAGYDIYYPHKVLVYHYYNRVAVTRHWHDNEFEYLDQLSRKRYWSLFAGEDLGPYSLGSERSLGEYEEFSGINFRRRIITERAYRGYPNTPEYRDMESDSPVDYTKHWNENVHTN